MEESEKRKERLRMMRNEASEAEGSSTYQSPAGALANPLVETPIAQENPAMSRFDYYTDPMAAYAGNKRPNVNQSPQHNSISRGLNAARPNPVMQYPPPPTMRPGNNPQMHQMPPPPPNYYSHQGMQHGWRPPPPNYHGFPNQPSNYHHPIPRPGQWDNRGPPFQNQGRGGTHYPNQGRGRSMGQVTNNSHVSRGGDATSAGLYRRSMVVDPWKDLEPVVWRATSSRSSEMFRKFSSDMKKPRVEEASSSVPKSNESLADYLAAAFDEAVEGGDAS